MFGGLDPRRARDLRDRRERYERRARSIRYGTVRAGSVRHILQTLWRAFADLRRPSHLLMLVAGAGAACAAAGGLGTSWPAQLMVAALAVPTILVAVGLVTCLQETLRTRRNPGRPPLVSPPERPVRRARQGS